MTPIRAHLDEPVDDVAARLRQVAGEQGWALAEAEGGPGDLVFKKGVTATSWGSQLTARLESESPTRTSLTFVTKEAWFTLIDWGRGSRQVSKLIEALGATRE